MLNDICTLTVFLVSLQNDVCLFFKDNIFQHCLGLPKSEKKMSLRRENKTVCYLIIPCFKKKYHSNWLVHPNTEKHFDKSVSLNHKLLEPDGQSASVFMGKVKQQKDFT